MAMVADPTESARWLRVGDTFQGYVIEGAIGVGGMSEVYRARHAFLGHRVALKVLQLRRASNPRLVALATAEARALAQLRHENLVHVIDAGIAPGGIVWMVMPLLEGVTLRDYLWNSPELSVVDALRFCRDICDGVHAAHEAGIVHRDLKPENVFVTREQRVVVIDLGMAKFQDFGLATTGSGPPLGTVRYMSPEHMAGERVDGRTDVYAVAVMLHEMLAGEHPFGRGEDGEPLNNTQIGWAIMGRDPAPLRSLRPDVPAYVEDIVLRAMAKNREARPPTITALAGELRRARAEALAALAARGPRHVEAASKVADTPGQRQVYIPAQTEPERLPSPRMPSRRVVLAAADARPASETQPLGWSPGPSTPVTPLSPVPQATTEPLSPELAAWAAAQGRPVSVGQATGPIGQDVAEPDAESSSARVPTRAAGWFRPAVALEPAAPEVSLPRAARTTLPRWTARRGLVAVGAPVLAAVAYALLAGGVTGRSEGPAASPSGASAASAPSAIKPAASADFDAETPALPSASASASGAASAALPAAPRSPAARAPARNGEVHGAPKF
jgi:serine/threonine protein kinase